MSSTITNYSNAINIAFPVAGEDNDSQGFRTNFSNIQNAFKVAATEIGKLQLTNGSPSKLIKIDTASGLGNYNGKALANDQVIVYGEDVWNPDGIGLVIGPYNPGVPQGLRMDASGNIDITSLTATFNNSNVDINGSIAGGGTLRVRGLSGIAETGGIYFGTGVGKYMAYDSTGVLTQKPNGLSSNPGLLFKGISQVIVSANDATQGGQVTLEVGSLYQNPTIATDGIYGPISIDVRGKQLRFHEMGDTAETRGAYIDITKCSTGTSTDLLSNGVGGTGQTWKNFSPSPGPGGRVSNTWYTNNTGRPIQVVITSAGGSSNYIYIIQAGTTTPVIGPIANTWDETANSQTTTSFIVPAGAQYRSGDSEHTTVIVSWWELRT